MSYLLFADDHAPMRAMVRDLLEADGHEVALAADGAAALVRVAERAPDLLLLDVMMPGCSGLEVCRRVKSDPRTAGVPVLMLTGEGSVDDKVAGFDAGADDYLPKPFHPRELRARTAALLRLVRRELDRNPTSGLPGGRALDEALAERAAEGRPFAVCYLDVDHFKAFNDAFGFAAADAVIRDAGAVLCDAVAAAGVGTPADGRRGDFVGHVGGDDFVVLTEPARAAAVAKECARRFAALVARRVGAAAAARGTFRAPARDGVVREYALPALTAAVVVVDGARAAARDADPDALAADRLGARAADVKRRAKAAGGGAVLVEAL